MPKNLSIIVPVYNASKYIKKCLDSFALNLPEDTQIIIVDDCSTDDSVNIVEAYISEKKLNNILLIKNETNVGAGCSKNKALELVQGRYVGFIDSDDYVSESYFQNMLFSALEHNSDIVVSDIILKYDNREEKNNIFYNNLYSKVDKEEIIIPKELVFGNWSCASTCNKLFRFDLIKNIKFSDKKSDDIIFSINALVSANKISYCRENYYYYYQSPNSLTRNTDYQKYEDSMKCLFDAVDILYENDIEFSKIYSANALFPTICYSLTDISLKNISSFLEVIKFGFKDPQRKSDLLDNPYLKRNALYASKFYRVILKNIKKDNYVELENQLIKHEDVSKYEKKISYQLKDDFNPLVTIVIPVFNGSNYIREAIESALNQTYKNIEILVVDDGSKDNTEEICREFKNKISYIKKENGGVASALNLAVDKMNGEYFSWLSHDDLYFDDKIEKQISFLSNLDNKKVVLYSDYILINENGRRLGEPVIIDHKMVQNKKEYILLRGSVNGITTLIPKVMLDENKFDVSLRCTQDYDLWHRLLKQYDFIHVPQILSKTRIHSLQDTNVSPRVVSEGETLWTNMIEDVSNERKKFLEGSVYNFYYQMAVHLKSSPYVKTCEMCINRCKEIDLKKYNKNPIINVKDASNISKVIYCFKNFGLIYTSRLVVKKLLKK